MKKSYIALLAFVAALTSCVENFESNFQMEKPESVIEAERLNALNVLNSYVDHSKNPNFRFGIGVNSADYVAQGVTYSIAKTNFDVVVDNNVLRHNSILADDGTYSLVNLSDMFLEDSPSVLGGPMISYNIVNKEHFDNVISPTFVKGDLENGKFTVADFENDAIGTTYEMSNGSIATVIEDPTGDSGNVLSIGTPENPAKNSYAVFNVSLPNGLTIGNCISVVFDIYCIDTNSQKKALVMIVNGQRKNFTGDTPDKRGCPLDGWGRKIIELNFADVDKLTDEDRALSEFTLCLGPNVVNSYYYIDNVVIYWQSGEPDKYVEKTEAEKAEALALDFNDWANAVMSVTAGNVNEYVVVSDPMSDDDAYMQRNEENETDLGNPTDASFFFNDYMGDNYVAKITNSLQKAYSENGGTSALKLYVSESNLLGNSGKTSRLLEQVKQWDAAGAKIDGIAVNLSLTYYDSANQQQLNESNVERLFEALASSGKMIRLDNVTMSNVNADFYKFVVNKYFSIIPSDKRAGIIFASYGELWKNGARTPAYEAVIEGLK